MHETLAKLNFKDIPVPQDNWKDFLTPEYAEKLYCPKDKLIFNLGNGLGDSIATINYAYQLSEVLLHPIGIVTKYPCGRIHGGAAKKIPELISAFGSDFSDRVYLSDQIWGPRPKLWQLYYAIPYV